MRKNQRNKLYLRVEELEENKSRDQLENNTFHLILLKTSSNMAHIYYIFICWLPNLNSFAQKLDIY